MTALVTKHLPLVAGAPDGLKKLRDLVLELAVCGRLVAQDESDEPADLLIDRIEALKASQISSGAVKRQKAATQPTVQPNHAIPESWRFVQLGDVVEIVRGITFPASEKSKEPSPGRIACLRTANVQSQIEWDDLLYIDESFVSREDQFLQPNDIVMSMANSRELVGKVALVGEAPLQRSTFGGFLGVLRPYLIEPRFVMALLRTPSARSVLIDSASQTTNIANISLAKLRPLMVALPPLAEQHRIVTKVDELMALCDRLEADQADADAAHAHLVQALLGSLTQATDVADFRASWQRLSEHFHTLFTTEASIDALKQAIRELAIRGALTCGSRAIDDQRTGSKNVSGSFPIPRDWNWVTLNNLVLDLRYGTSTKCSYECAGTPVLRIPNVGEKLVTLDDLKYGELSEDEKKSYTLKDGDILMIRSNGSASLVGRTAIVGADAAKCAFAGYLVRIRLPRDRVTPEYFHLALGAHHVRSSIEAPIRTTSGVKNINSTEIRGLQVPLPPLPVQHRIVAKVDELMALCDQLKAQLAKARQRQGQLATALVEQAVA